MLFLNVGAIPVGIAVARQRLQEHAQQQQQQHQTKDINRFGTIGIATDLGKFRFYDFHDCSWQITTDEYDIPKISLTTTDHGKWLRLNKVLFQRNTTFSSV